ncbi:MAG: DUF4012 domain-containing protein [Patescibacteria group bacterium]
MREQERKEFLSVFFGRVVSREVVAFADQGREKVPPRAWSARTRSAAMPKEIPINAAAQVSRHVVDLTPFSARPSVGPRPHLDFEQKLNVFVHALRSAMPGDSDEHRDFMPSRPDRKASRASIGGFLKLPFALLALPFKAKPSKASTQPSIMRRPAVVVRSFSAPHPMRQIPQASRVPMASRPYKTPTIKVMPTPERPKMSFVFQSRWLRRAATFAVIALIVSLPLQALLSYTGLLKKAGVIAAGAKEAVGGLRDAGSAALARSGEADASFGRAAGAFAETRGRVDDISVRLAAILTGNGDKLASGKRLLAAGEAAAKAGEEMAAGYESIDGSPETVAKKLERMSFALAAALPHLEAASSELDAIPLRSLPERFRAPFAAIREDAAGAVSDIRRAAASSDILLDAIGANGKRRYLVIFQNSRELRPTGGFIGSYALMDLKDGSIEKIEIPAGGSYDLRGGSDQRVEAPEQLRLVNARWEFQDANWFADFPTSAQSLVWFYEKSGGPTVDGVIAVTSNMMEDLLAAVGPVAMPEYGKTIDAGNFHLETQKSVEIEYDRETNRPKQIISDMAPKLLKRLLDSGAKDMPKLAAVFGGALAGKDVQVWFRDAEAQAAATDFGWTGELAPPEGGDFLAVVDTNIAGGKTDGSIKADIRHETRIEETGAIVDTVTVTRTHRGKKGDLFTGIKNIDYLRLYVPKGSELLSADGFEAPGAGYFLPEDDTLKPSTLLAAVEGQAKTHESTGTRVTEESGLAVFGNWVQLEPGETRSVKISYRLPFRIQELVREPVTRFEKVRDALGAWSPTATMKLVVRKQPGTLDRDFSSRIDLPKGWRVESSLPDEASADHGGLTLDTKLDRDLFVGMLLVNRD